MVKLQRRDAAVVAADRAVPAGFLDEQALGAPPPFADALLAAQGAAVVAAPLQHEARHSVASAMPLGHGRRGGWVDLSGSVGAPDLPAVEPGPDRPEPTGGGLGHLPPRRPSPGPAPQEAPHRSATPGEPA